MLRASLNKTFLSDYVFVCDCSTSPHWMECPLRKLTGLAGQSSWQTTVHFFRSVHVCYDHFYKIETIGWCMVHFQKQEFLCVCMYICVCASACMCVCKCMHVCLHVVMCVHMHACVCVGKISTSTVCHT